MIALHGISKSFATVRDTCIPVLRDIDLVLAPAQVVAIMGPSGSGKSTLLNIAGLLDRPDRGAVIVDGQDTAALGDRVLSRLRGSTFGFVFQQFHLLARRSALDNVAAALLQGSRSEIRRRRVRATETLEGVGLGHRLAQCPEQLSGGEQQRVAIARALARHPRYVLADEPTGSLDHRTGRKVLEVLLDAVRVRQCGLLINTHDPQVAEVAHHVFHLDDGQLRERAP